jgi:hypothetical protein
MPPLQGATTHSHAGFRLQLMQLTWALRRHQGANGSNCVVMLTAVAHSQGPGADRNRRELGFRPAAQHGQNIEVHRFGAEPVSGKFLSVTPDVIVVGRGSGSVTVLRTDVRQVKARRASRRLRNGVVGAAIGVGVGAAIGVGVGAGGTAFAVRGDFDGDGLAAALTVIVAMIGAGVGLGVGLTIPGYGTVYKAVK